MHCIEPVDYIFWKQRIKQIVFEMEIYRWKVTCNLYPQLNVYSRNVVNIEMNVWWRFVRNNPKCALKVNGMVALLCGVQPKQLQRNLDLSKVKCLLCQCRVRDDIFHVIIDCPKTLPAQVDFWSKITNKMPLAMKRNLLEMSKHRAIEFILSGFGGTYIKEWDDIYENVAVQVWEIYRNRMLEIDEM